MENYKIKAVKKSRSGVRLTLQSVEYGDTREIVLSEKLWDGVPFGCGDVITAGEADELERLTLTARAFETAKSVLSYSGHSRRGLVRKLCDKGFSKEIAEDAADMTVADGLLNEDREASHKASYYLRHKKWGKRRISSELAAKGYAKSAVQKAVDELDEDEIFENLVSLVENKPLPTDRNGRQKYIASFCRMGYTTGEVISAIKEAQNRDE